ncbi:MAG: flagellar basal body rod protein FlgB [Hyphomicrobiales bacterium]
MAITDLPIFSALRTRMKWHEARQRVLAENVANADTPGFRGQDLKPLEFDKDFKVKTEAPGVNTVRTDPAHISGQPISGNGPFGSRRITDFETTPEGNRVVLEEEMMKVTANQMDYQTVAALYSRGIGLIKTALGRNA